MSENIGVISFLLFMFSLGLRVGYYISEKYLVLVSISILFFWILFCVGIFKDNLVESSKYAYEFAKNIWILFLSKINYPLVNKYESRIKNYENIIKGLQKNLENKTNEHDTPTSAIEVGTYR